MADAFKNFAKAVVSTGYNSSATSIVLSSGHGAKLPTVPFNAVWFDSAYADPSDDPNVEIVRVTAISTDTLTVTRGQESITATSKNTASHTYWLIAALTARTLNTDIFTDLTTTGNTVLGNASADTLNVGNGGLVKDTSNNFGLNMTPHVAVVLDIKEPDAATDLIVGLTAGTGARAQIASVAQPDGTTSAISIRTTTAGNTVERMLIDSSGHTTPGADNTQNFGSGARRWATIYAGTGTINTSDIRLKQDIRDPIAAEVKVAKELKSLIKLYRFKDAVALKGDGARIHVGVIAQEVLASFARHGLDAHRYGLFCKDDDRYSIRYEELIMFILTAE